MKLFDSRPLAELPARELYALGDALAAYVRHPATRSMPNLCAQAGDRLAAVMAEADARWRNAWYHDNNHDVNNVLNHVYRIFG